MTSELSRIVSVDRLPAEFTVQATAGERAALAARMQVPEVRALACCFALSRRGGVVIGVGFLTAAVVQSCVVTLEPVEQSVAEAFTLHFVPEGTEVDSDDPESPDEVPYSGSSIDLGEATAEQLALALDPYPRADGAELEIASDSDQTVHPFASLKTLRGE